jgi:hypothetical protein
MINKGMSVSYVITKGDGGKRPGNEPGVLPKSGTGFPEAAPR